MVYLGSHRQGLSERILNVDVYRQSVVVKSAATVRVGDVFVFGCSFQDVYKRQPLALQENVKQKSSANVASSVKAFCLFMIFSIK